MAELKSICVYCGSNSGIDPDFEATARELGVLMAKAGIRLVYGGGSVGLMGILARSALAAGGKENGQPGLRTDYGPDYFAAYVLDPDGYRLEAYCSTKQS